MKNIFGKILKLAGILVGYVILTVLVFYITGMYIWTTPPTPLVLKRMIGFPVVLTIATVLFIWLVQKIKRQRKKE